jgi:hypothetical protein
MAEVPSGGVCERRRRTSTAEGRDIYGDIERAEDAASDHAAIFVNINA